MCKGNACVLDPGLGLVLGHLRGVPTGTKTTKKSKLKPDHSAHFEEERRARMAKLRAQNEEEERRLALTG
jgi:Na+/glutamate symporter